MFTLKKFRPDIPEIYSYDNFLREYARMSLFGFIIAAQFLQVLWDPEDIDFANYFEETQRLGKDFFIQVNYPENIKKLITF
jgi:hypothetical protein